MIYQHLTQIILYFFGFLALDDGVLAQDFTCSASKPCASGCCGGSGFCGLGPTFCGAGNCTSSCDQKSDCDPGWGPQWSNAETCPLNVCCSQFGFCGTTSDFCGNETVVSPSCSGTSATNRVMGYYEGWSPTRNCDQMYPEGIPTGAFTHLNYAFAFVDPSSFAIAPMSDQDAELYPRFTALKSSNPGLETWISVGGWSMNDADQPTADTFSTLAGSTSAQSSFFSSLLTFMSTFGFDGVDIDWEYPVAPERSGNPADFKNYVSFLKNLRNALSSEGHHYGLTITIPSSYWYLRNFDIVNIAEIIDWFNVMTYDLHGTWDSTDPSIGAIVQAHTNLTEINQTMDLLWRNNIDPAKVTMGLGFYGRSFTLSNPSCTTAGCPFSSGGNPGPCTSNSGTLSFTEIQSVIAGGATVTLDKEAAVEIVTWDSNQWVSYDDDTTFKLKMDFANSKCLGGTMVWASSLDSNNGTAAGALSASTGLQIKALSDSSVLEDSISSCVWGECNSDCPASTSPDFDISQAAAPGSKPGKSNNGVPIWSGCTSGQTRNYCCPTNGMPTCTWRGGAPFCNGVCHSGEVQVASDLSAGGSECWTGHKVLCCTSTSADQSAGQCSWKGSAPFCGNPSCPAGQSTLTSDSVGAGGEEYCATGSKTLCCSQPAPYTNCDWVGRNGINRFLQLTCTAKCPVGQYPIATDPSWCDVGSNQFCCDVPTSLDDPQLEAFQTQLKSFASDPVCAALTVTKRANGLSMTDQTSLISTLTGLFRSGAQTSLQSAQLQLYSQLLEPDFGAEPSDFVSYYDSFPGNDPVHLTSLLFCNGNNVSTSIKDQKADQDLCILPTTVQPQGCRSPPKHDEFKRKLKIRSTLGSLELCLKDAEPDKRKRTISISEDGTVVGPNQQPSIAALMTAVLNGEMTFQYYNVIQINDRTAAFDNFFGPTNNQQGIVELAWLMGENNQITNVNPNYQEFGGTDITVRPPNGPPDMFFVMHFHVDHIMYDDSGRPFVGIYAYNAFHGQFINGQNRVDGNSVTRNQRTPLVQCPGYGGPAGNNEYIYPGFDVDSNSIQSVFLNYLDQQGLLVRHTLAPIIVNGGEQDNCEFFDWTLLPGGSTGSTAQNGAPYNRPSGF